MQVSRYTWCANTSSACTSTGMCICLRDTSLLFVFLTCWHFSSPLSLFLLFSLSPSLSDVTWGDIFISFSLQVSAFSSENLVWMLNSVTQYWLMYIVTKQLVDVNVHLIFLLTLTIEIVSKVSETLCSSFFLFFLSFSLFFYRWCSGVCMIACILPSFFVSTWARSAFLETSYITACIAEWKDESEEEFSSPRERVDGWKSNLHVTWMWR